MPRCQAQRGFLALRRCDGESVGACAVCSRSLCAAHLVGDRCTECADAGADWRTDPAGPNRFRRRFYEESDHLDHSTLFWGSGYGFSGSYEVDQTGSEGAGWDS